MVLYTRYEHVDHQYLCPLHPPGRVAPPEYPPDHVGDRIRDLARRRLRVLDVEQADVRAVPEAERRQPLDVDLAPDERREPRQRAVRPLMSQNQNQNQNRQSVDWYRAVANRGGFAHLEFPRVDRRRGGQDVLE